MKKPAALTGKPFKKRKTFSSLFSEAIAEGMRDTFKEMGYDLKDKNGSEVIFSSKEINNTGIATQTNPRTAKEIME
jgi:hypothetical protein